MRAVYIQKRLRQDVFGNYFFSMYAGRMVEQDAADRLSRTRSQANVTSMNLIEMIRIFSCHYPEADPIMLRLGSTAFVRLLTFSNE
jgi:hypothetical protein